MKKEKYLKAKPIKNGTVIDHIPADLATEIYEILKPKIKKNKKTLILLDNVESKSMGLKGIIKLEDAYLDPEDFNILALISKDITINVIRNWEVKEKYKVKTPEAFEGLFYCPNPNCITNLRNELGVGEPIKPKYYVIERNNETKVKCYYCEREIERDDILTLLKERRYIEK